MAHEGQPLVEPPLGIMLRGMTARTEGFNYTNRATIAQVLDVVFAATSLDMASARSMTGLTTDTFRYSVVFDTSGPWTGFQSRGMAGDAFGIIGLALA